jgi:hypothetical protein
MHTYNATTYVTGGNVYPESFPPPRLPRLLEFLKSQTSYFEAVGRSRELARLPDAPQRRPRLVPRPYSSARMVHAQRCPMRRPRLSLLERARAVVL